MRTSLHARGILIAAGLLATALYLCEPTVRAVNVLTQHNDISRGGANTSETNLTTSNVNSNSFGLLFTNGVDGQVYAQPLYVQGMSISGGTHNVLFICTETNSVYAFDADTGATYWHTNLGTPTTSYCGDMEPVCGLTGTPVIDLSTGTLYCDARLISLNGGHQLHALNITNGNEKFNGPVTISATTNFTTSQLQRPGLLELSNVIYVCYGSQCDADTYHGFVLGYNATNISQQLYSWDSTPNGSMGAIWNSGMGPAADTNGNIYVITANGTYDGTTNSDYSQSMVKLSSHLALLDWATPSNYAALTAIDQDFGTGGGVLLPGGYLIGMGKDGYMNVANITNMGHVGHFVQQFLAVQSNDITGVSPVYWQGPGTNFVFASHANSVTYSYAFTGTNINTNALGTNTFTEGELNGGLSLSANGTNNGILWSIDTDATLRAYDAAHFPKLLWSGSVPGYQKENCPTIANGKVYVAASNGFAVFGLISPSYQSVILGDAPVSYWPMQETNGPTIYDIVSTNNGTLVTSTDNNIGLGYHTNFVTAGSGATDGGTYHFAGPGGLSGVSNDTAIYFTNLNTSTSNSQIVVAYNSAIDPSNNLTAEAWVKVPTYPISYTNTTFQVPLGLEAYGGAENGWWVAFETDSSGSEGEVQFNLAHSYGEGWTTSTSTASLAGTWVYLVEVYNGANSNLLSYTNGVLMADVAMGTNYESEGVYGTHKLPFIIGSFCSPGGASGGYNGGGTSANGYERGNFWHGAISHVAIYNTALTASQITNHYYYGTNSPGTAPSITSQPSSATNYTTQTATFSVSASGTTPLSYQWKVESSGSYANLSNGGQFSGVTTTTLTISNLALTNATNYEVVVTNSAGSVTSSAATLTVLNAAPSITTQPSNTTNTVGQTTTFTVAAAGEPTLSYQWRVESSGSYANLSNGGQFSGVTTTTLTISNLALTNVTNYEVVVTNSAGSVTSSAATLTVNSSANYQSVILGDTPVGYWPMQETNGTTITDATGNGNTGTMYVSTDAVGSSEQEEHLAFTNSNSGFTLGAAGLLGASGDTSIAFNTVNAPGAEIAVPYTTNLDTTNFSGEGWLKIPSIPISYTGTSTSNNMTDLAVFGPTSGGGDSHQSGWLVDLNLNNGGRVDGWVGENSGWGTITTGATNQSGKVVYIVETYDGTDLRLYTNGILVAAVAATHYTQAASGHTLMPFVLGSYQQDYFTSSTPTNAGYERTRFYTGNMAHVAVYNYALSSSQITNHYSFGTNSGSGGAFKSPIAPTFKPTIGATLTPALLPGSSAKQFQMQVSAVANQNYTLQICTDLSSGKWVSLYTTNSTTNTTFNLTDPTAATNKQRFYRVLIGP